MMKDKIKKGVIPSGSDAARCRLGTRPKNDNGYFEQLTKVVFKSGLNWTMIDNKWSAFSKAFAGFSVDRVAHYDVPEIERLMKNTEIIRNYRKIVATVDNAKEFVRIREEFGTFRKFLNNLSKGGEEFLSASLSKRFAFLGKSATLFFLRSVGEEMPETMRGRESGR